MGLEVVHSYVVVITNGGLPSRDNVGEEVVMVVETGGSGSGWCWCCVAAVGF